MNYMHLEPLMYKLGIPHPIPYEHPMLVRDDLEVVRDTEDTGHLLSEHDLGILELYPDHLYAADGYLYSDRDKTIRLRKWFAFYELPEARKTGITLWLPALSDILLLEQMRWQEVKVLDALYEQQAALWAEVRAVNEQGDPVYMPLRKRESDTYATHEIFMKWRYDPAADKFWHCQNCLYPGDTRTHERHTELGTRLADLQDEIDKHGIRQTGLSALLENKIQTKLPDRRKGLPGQQARVEINSRNYHYHKVFDGQGGVWWQKLSWPDTDVVVVVVNED